MGEDPGEIVRNLPHDKAVEERDSPRRAGPGEDAAGGQETVVGQRLGKAHVHRRAQVGGLSLGKSGGHP